MKIDGIRQQNLNSFRGGAPIEKGVNFVSKHPNFIIGLAGCSVLTQKMFQSCCEATFDGTIYTRRKKKFI